MFFLISIINIVEENKCFYSLKGQNIVILRNFTAVKMSQCNTKVLQIVQFHPPKKFRNIFSSSIKWKIAMLFRHMIPGQPLCALIFVMKFYIKTSHFIKLCAVNIINKVARSCATTIISCVVFIFS